MKRTHHWIPAALLTLAATAAHGGPPASVAIDSGPGWQDLKADDFTAVNCPADTWSWADGVLHCTGQPVGVIRTRKQFTNFELVVEWRHLAPAGNSGVFCWAIPESLEKIAAADATNRLPDGIEVQILDPGYKAKVAADGGKTDWFTCHGDVFAVGAAKLTPFPPLSPDGSRSFPTAETTRPSPQWNHYYVRAVNGEVRLWVNGTKVSGGTAAQPASGFLCLESEGSPVEFRHLRLRPLP